MQKPVLLVLLCGLVSLAAALRPTEGSGDTSRQLSDMEDLEDVREDDGLLEGSGDEDEEELLSPVNHATTDERKKSGKGKKKVIAPSLPDDIDSQFEYDIHLSKLDEDGNEAAVVTASATEKTTAPKKTDDLYEYYDDLYPEEYKDLIKNYDNNNNGEKDEDYNYTDSSDFDRDSVLKIDEQKEANNDIEIKPRPTSDTEEAILETSQIFIMVGSAFVSFAIVMLAFFLCRRAMAQKVKKSNLAFAYIPDTRTVKESSIVKDYQKVPTSTKELLQYQSTRFDMYRAAEPAAASAPLVQTP